jgi:shikimate kinase
MRRAIVIVGPPGAGKSTAGRAAAAQLGLSFADLDEEIERLRGRPIDEVFREGEATFRALELFVLPPLLRATQVIAAGAGVVDGARARALLASGPCVLLDVEAEVALGRLGFGRPWLAEAQDRRARYLERERDRRERRATLVQARVAGDGALADVVGALAQVLRRLA